MIKSTKTLWRILPDRYKKRALFLIVFLIIGAIAELISVGVLLPTIKLMQNSSALNENTWYQRLDDIVPLPTDEKLFVFLFSFVLLVFVVKSISLLFINKYQFNLFARIQSDLSSRLFTNYILSEYGYFFDVNSSVLVRSVTEDVKNVVVLVVFSSITIVTELLVAIPLLMFLVWLNPLVSFITFFMGGVSFYLISVFVSKQLKPLGSMIQKDSSKLIQNVQESVDGIKELKILSRESFFIKLFDARATSYAFGLGRYLFLNTIPRLILELMFVSIFLVVLLLLTFDGGLYESLPMLAVYGAASFRLIPGLNRAAAAYNSISMGQASLEVIVKGLEGSSAKEQMPENNDLEPLCFETLSVNAISFCYPDGKLALKNLSLSLTRGEVVGLIGSSGAGKTTLVNLLLGLLTPNEGQILVNGEDIQNNVKRWQSLIGYVPQNMFLIDGSIRNNIALGISAEEIDDSKIWSSLRQSNLESFVKSLPAGLDTEIGEKGIKFSGGQQQRVGIARALYRGPSVLVMDEATSALDSKSEQEVVREVALLKRQKTIIIITHRMSSLSSCDRIFEIENGTIHSIKSYNQIA